MNRKEKNNFKNFTEFKIYYQDKIKVKGILGFNWSLIFALIYLPATLSLYIIKQITDYILLQALPIFLLVFIMILFIKKYFKILDIIEIKYLEYKKNHIIHDKGEKVNDNGRGQHQRTRPTRWINGIKQDANTADGE